ncbi:MAG: FapA family protein [Spirochaetales bacterium]|nr:FapA family protein [Spirochaetales bacterium]
MSSNNDSGKRFSLYYRNGFAVLRVYPPASPDNRVFAEEVINRMKILEIPMVRMIKIEEIIEQADGSVNKLVEWPAGAHLSPHIQVRIREDRMKAEIFIEPPKIGGGGVTEEILQHVLRDNRISSGIDKSAIERCILSECYNEWICVAQGTPAVDGRGGQVQYNFSLATGKPFRELPFGRIDLKELNFIQYKEAGDVLAELQAPVEPVDGTDIFGERVEAKASDEGESLVPGDNTEIKGNTIVALESGNVRLDRGAVIVEPVVTVNNVDYETGNLSFPGSVIVKGHVADGFSVKASGDIQIAKSVGRVHLEAGRNLILQSGINGDKEGHLGVGGDLYARFIESSFAEVKGSAFISGSLLNSTVKIDGDLLLEGGRCEIVGGLTVVKEWVKCRKIGSLYEAKTNVVAGVPPKDLDEFFDALKELENLRHIQNEMDKQLAYYTKQCSGPEATPLNYRQKDQAEAQVREAGVKIAYTMKKIQQMRKELIPSEESFILVEDIIYSGSKISFGLLEFTVDQRGAKKTILQARDGRIKETGYNPAQIPEEIRKALPGPK